MEKEETVPESKSQELQSNASQITNEARASLDDIDADFSARIDSLHSKLDSTKRRAEQFKPENKNASGLNPSEARGLGVGLTVAYAIIGTPLFLYFVGLLIDKAVGTDTNLGLKWSNGLLLFGAVIGVWFAIMTTQKHNK